MSQDRTVKMIAEDVRVWNKINYHVEFGPYGLDPTLNNLGTCEILHNIMLNENELRLGSWVLWSEIPVQITSWVIMGRTIDKNREGRAHPIKLTPEVLLKCGFPEIRNVTFLNKDFDSCQIALIQKLDVYMVNTTGPFGMVTSKSIKYLHQLQNVYQALLQKELEYKPGED